MRVWLACSSVLLLWAAPAASFPTFLPRTDHPTGAGSTEVAIRDLNGDTVQDLVAANYSGGTISVLLGTGSGYSAGTTYAAGTNPFSVVTGLLNGDALPDLVVSNWSSANISVYLGTGGGGFDPQVTYPTGSGRPISPQLVDLNTDGELDLVLADWTTNQVKVMLGDGLGGFAAPLGYAGGTRPYSLGIADLNGDNQPDVLAANRGVGTISVLMGQVGGSFGAPTAYAVGADPISVALGDFDEDGEWDVAVANFGATTVSRLLGDGLGGFGSRVDLNVAAAPLNLAIGELDLNGHVDIVVGFASIDAVAVLPGDGSGGFLTSTQFATATAPNRVSLGDINADGRTDIALASAGANVASVFLNTTGQFTVPHLLAACAMDDQHVLAKFDVAVTSASATNIANYTLASFGSINSATIVDTNLVRLHVTNGLAPGEIETLTASGIVASSSGLPMTSPNSRSFHIGVLSISAVQDPDPQALADSCADRSRFAGPGENPGELVTLVGVPVGPYNNFTQAVMCDTSGASPRGSLFVNCPDLKVYSGVVYRFTGRIVERGGETMLKAVTHCESLYVTSRAESEFVSHPSSPSAVNLNACDAAQGLETGEDFEGSLVRFDEMRIWRADPARELFVVGPPGDPSDTVGVLNINLDTHYPYDVGRDLNLTGAVVHRDGRFMIAPRGHGDIGLLNPDLVFHGLPHWVFGPGQAVVVGSAPNDTLKLTNMAGDGSDGVRVGLATGTNSWAVSLSMTPDTPGLPSDRVDFDVSYKEKQGDPDIKMISAHREAVTKGRYVGNAIQGVDSGGNPDTQDVEDKVNQSDAARASKKAKNDVAGSGKIIKDGGTVGEEDYDATQDTTFFWESESTPGVSPMFRTMQLRVVNERPVLDLFWPQDVQLTITKNEQTTSAIGDQFQLSQVQGPWLIESLTDVTFSFRDATSASIWGEGASATADVGDGPRGPRVGLRCVNNPVVGKARLELSLSAPGRAEVELFDVAGRRLHQWTIPGAQPGVRTLVWDPSRLDRPAPSGVVFARASAGGATWTTKFVFLR